MDSLNEKWRKTGGGCAQEVIVFRHAIEAIATRGIAGGGATGASGGGEQCKRRSGDRPTLGISYRSKQRRTGLRVQKQTGNRHAEKQQILQQFSHFVHSRWVFR